MTVVNREAMSPMHSPEVETTLPEVPVGRSSSSRQEVESFKPSDTSTAVQQQGSSVGSIAARSVDRLDANAVVSQVKVLMANGLLDRVSRDECEHAIGLLQSLPHAEYGKALKELSRSGALRVLCEAAPAELRRDLAQSAVEGGLTTATKERLAPGLRQPQPPPQPSLIVNSPSLPVELRQVIHDENLTRARQYEADFNAYADAWCAKVGTCKSPMELRELGPLSNPPSLVEPGISSDDFAAKRFVSLHCQTNIGAERAAKAVSDQVSAFRGELTAGGFGLDFQLKAQVVRKAEGPGHTEGAGGFAFVAKGTLTQDGRVINQHVEDELLAEVGRGHTKLEAKFTPAGHLEAVSGEVGGAGLELDREGKATFKAPIAPGLGTETFVDAQKAAYGGVIVGDAAGEFFGATLKLEAKIGFTLKGVERSYYSDIGGSQTGFFGPMPELAEGMAWAALPSERREWYERQGFSERSWPR